MAMPIRKPLPELPSPFLSTVVACLPERAVIVTSQQPEFFCESCRQPITHISDVILEPEYGFEGEAWGTYFRQEPRNIAISRCCRSPIVDASGESIDAYILEEEL